MIITYAIVAAALIAGGAALGILAVISLGRRANKVASLTIDSPGRAASETWPSRHQSWAPQEDLPALRPEELLTRR